VKFKKKYTCVINNAISFSDIIQLTDAALLTRNKNHMHYFLMHMQA